MAMIEQLSPRLRAALTRRAIPYAGGGATLLVVLLFGFSPLWLHLTTTYGYLLIPGAIGVPALLPGLRLSPLGGETGTMLLCEDFAALLMVLIVAAVLGRHVRTYPNSGRGHRLLVGWGALVLAGSAAGFFRGLVVARMVAGGPLSYFGYPALGAFCGAAWSMALGWIPGLAALFAVDARPALARAADRTPALVGAVHGRLLQPALVAVRRQVRRAVDALEEHHREGDAAWPGRADSTAHTDSAFHTDSAVRTDGIARTDSPVRTGGTARSTRTAHPTRPSKGRTKGDWQDRAIWAAGLAADFGQSLLNRVRPWLATAATAVAAFTRKAASRGTKEWTRAVKEGKGLRDRLRKRRSGGSAQRTAPVARDARGEKHQATRMTTP
ncbi:hypothetical protein [Streptacidiphilus albus]|uniref:hypothetical protein n=1 Tax=Streptacidiphilus albus TaxID=105425 RepID=UPI00068FEA33|nr:hypothetical protein [Streptacidiphilus albus]